MRKLFNLTLLLGIMLLASCSSEIDVRDNPLLLPGQVKFKSTIGAAEVTTRVTGTNWDQGDAIGVYALNAGQAIPDGVYGKANAKFTTPDAAATAEFTAATAEDQIAYPKDGSKLDFVAYYPYTVEVDDYQLPIDVSVQTNSAIIDYLYSDNVKGKSILDESATLNFKHKLSQLIININGAAFDNLSSLTAVVKDMKVDGSLDLKDGAVTPGATVGDITPQLNSEKTVATAIVVPGQDMKDITVEFTLDGVKFVWQPEAQALESGKKYSYNIRLTKDGVVLDKVGATITDWEDGYIGTDDIILQPEGEEGGEEPVEPAEGLLFPGADFEDWDAFLGGLSSHGLKPGYTTQSNDGRNGSKALYLNGTPTGNDYVFTALVPEGFDPTGKNAIVFWMKGTATGKSLSLNVYKAGGGFQAFNLETYNSERVITPAVNNQYNGLIDTGGDWMKVVVDISSVDLITAVGESLFALKVGNGGVYDLLIDDITLEASDIKTFKADKTALSLGAEDNLTGTINLTSTEAWTATSSESWLTVAPASGTGNEAVALTAGKNEVESPRTATVTFKADGMDDVVVNVTQAAAEGEEPPVEDSNLLFPGADFEDWDEFKSSLGFAEKYIVQSADGEGRNSSKAMKLEVEKTDSSNGYLFTANAPDGFSAAGKTEINFWIRGVSQGRSISIDLITTGGKKYYNLGDVTGDVTLPPTGQNAYVGDINTGGDWIKVTLDISSLAADIVTSGNLISFKYGKEGKYDLLIDDITIE